MAHAGPESLGELEEPGVLQSLEARRLSAVRVLSDRLDLPAGRALFHSGHHNLRARCKGRQILCGAGGIGPRALPGGWPWIVPMGRASAERLETGPPLVAAARAGLAAGEVARIFIAAAAPAGSS